MLQTATVMCSPANAATADNNPEINNVRFMSPPLSGFCDWTSNPASAPSRGDIISWEGTATGEKVLGQAESASVTELLLRWRAGDQECLNRLLPQVEGELRRIRSE